MANNTPKVINVTAVELIVDHLKDMYEADSGELFLNFLVSYEVPLHPYEHTMLHSISNEIGMRPDVISRWLLVAALVDVYKALGWPVDRYSPRDLDDVKDQWKKYNENKTCMALD